MSELLDMIRTRGHWQVIIRPTKFVEKRVPDLADLLPLVRVAAVPLWGLEFPTVASDVGVHLEVDWVGQEIAWQHHLELWRLYQSGQFLDVSGIWEDWRDRSSYRPAHPDWHPGSHLGVRYLAKTYAAIFEFAARLALTARPATIGRRLEVTLRGLRGRVLFMDSGHRRSRRHYEATLDEWPYAVEVDRAELVAQPRELALSPARELCKRFGFNIGDSLLRDLREDER